jgi:hypothetical protein
VSAHRWQMCNKTSLVLSHWRKWIIGVYGFTDRQDVQQIRSGIVLFDGVEQWGTSVQEFTDKQMCNKTKLETNRMNKKIWDKETCMGTLGWSGGWKDTMRFKGLCLASRYIHA